MQTAIKDHVLSALTARYAYTGEPPTKEQAQKLASAISEILSTIEETPMKNADIAIFEKASLSW
jgi:phenylpyruvate tautomerase PptA (4-oxalocrotonate tautomerase family)